jgi:DNA-binding MarR family transcriptional regulator
VVEVDVAEIAAQLRLSTTRLARQLRRQSDTGLSPSQLSALASIDRLGPLTFGALAEIEGVAPPTITKVVTKLLEMGLIAKASDTADRRVWLVRPTPAGRRLLAESRRRRNAWLTSRIKGLPPKQIQALAAALEALEVLAEAEP